MAAIDWKNITFSGKEVIAAVAILVGFSGNYFTVRADGANTKAMVVDHIAEANVKWKDYNIRIESLEARVNELETKQRIQGAIQEYSKDYTPMHKVKR